MARLYSVREALVGTKWSGMRDSHPAFRPLLNKRAARYKLNGEQLDNSPDDYQCSAVNGKLTPHTRGTISEIEKHSTPEDLPSACAGCAMNTWTDIDLKVLEKKVCPRVITIELNASRGHVDKVMFACRLKYFKDLNGTVRILNIFI